GLGGKRRCVTIREVKLLHLDDFVCGLLVVAIGAQEDLEGPTRLVRVPTFDAVASGEDHTWSDDSPRTDPRGVVRGHDRDDRAVPLLDVRLAPNDIGALRRAVVASTIRTARERQEKEREQGWPHTRRPCKHRTCSDP